MKSAANQSPGAARTVWPGLEGGPEIAGRAGLALVGALIAALRDRGVLSREEIDEVLADAAHRSGYGAAAGPIAAIRREFENRDE